ncbi:hypothetical protein E1176_12750 [Fulvivirga sp. RKSG066]|uniref:hypothetical protein n=1 Tax=Fulvivirga aurantia TaxID=2529383 RepID=UPI0012BCCBF2|nr:hypothetical protein [Fulvivirga aurantia]MTI21894.1 hypothetical protein [Fulvivirga aurantia]
MNKFQVLHYHFTLSFKNLSFLEVGKSGNLSEEEIDEKRFAEAFEKEIKDKLSHLINHLKEGNQVLVYFSAPFLSHLALQNVATINQIKKYLDAGQVELIGSCAYHSLSYLCHKQLFRKEIELHQQSYREHFDQEAQFFINTAGLYDNDLCSYLHEIGYKTTVAPANSWHLSGVTPGEVHWSAGEQPLQVILANGDQHNSEYVSLADGYGSSYQQKEVQHAGIYELRNKLSAHQSKDIYLASMPLSSPEWVLPITYYISGPLQKALIREIKSLIDAHADRLSDDEWKILMLLCQPEKLLNLKDGTDENPYQAFIYSMNILTAIALRHT